MPKRREELRILYPKPIAYRLGDFQGSKIDQLRLKYCAKIYVSKCVGPYGYISITASTKKIVKVLSELVWSFVGIFRLTAGKLDERKIRRSSIYINLKLLVKNYVHSSLGRRASQLENIGRSVNTKIVFYSVDCPKSIDRVVEITGTPLGCIQSMKKILKMMESIPSFKTMDRYEPKNDPLFIKNCIDKLKGNANREKSNTLFQCDYCLDKFNTVIENYAENECIRLDEVNKEENNTNKRKIHNDNDEHNNEADDAVKNKKQKTNNDNKM